MSILKSPIAAFFCLIFFGNLLSGQATAQNRLPDLYKLNESVIKQNSINQPVADLQTTFDNLIVRARQNGAVRIILGFRLDTYRPDADLTRFEQTKQRADIKQQQAALLNRLNNFAVGNQKQFDYIPFLALEVKADALIAMRDWPEVTSLQEDIEQTPSLLQSVPLIGTINAWNAGFTGQGRTVAIIDTGVDKFHPFFNGRVVSEACYSTTSATTTSVCPGGVSQSTAPNSGLNCNINQIESCFHGTHVAGIAAGGNPQINGAGVARNANIIAIQVFSSSTSCGQNPAPCTTAFTSDTIRGLERVYALRTTYTIDAVNMSLGGGQYFNHCDAEQAAYKTIIDNLRAAGIASVVASGNESRTDSMSSPACVSSAISVGSTHDGSVAPVDFVSDFSNSAYFLNLLAPGELITSAYPGGFYYDTQGTSMAAPHVAGAWAIIKHKFPNDTVTQVLNRLTYSGLPVLDSRNGFVKPRIRIDTALNTPNTNPCDTVAPISFGQTVNGSLSTTDCLLSLGNRTDVFSFSGTQGQGVALTQSSAAFDTYLYLISATGTIVGQDNNGGGGTNSRIPAGSGFVQLPSTGTFYIYATSLSGNQLGNYTLTLTTNTPQCSFTVSSSGQTFPAAGGTGSFNVTTAAGCAWTAQTSAPSWLTITSGGSGNGNGTVNYSVAQNASPGQRSGTITVGSQTHTVTQSGTTAAPRRAFDFDGDGKTDISIFRPGAGEWWINRSSDTQTRALQFGVSTDKPVPADFTGDGKTDIAFFRPSTGQWFILRSEDNSFLAFPFGASGDIPIVGDFDADGRADPGVFRTSSSTWFILQSSGGTSIQQFGAGSDKPVIADYDGDGRSDIGIFRPNGASGAEWWIARSTAGILSIQFGSSTDKPVQGDYSGDGKADIAFFRPSNGQWFILRSENFSFYSFPFGAAGDTAAPGDYDGDGRFDPAVFRPSAATWYINRSQAGVLITGFGAAADTPVPSVFVP